MVRGIALAREGLDQGGLAAAVRPKNRDVLPNGDRQRDAIERECVAAIDGDVLIVEERGCLDGLDRTQQETVRPVGRYAARETSFSTCPSRM